MIIINLFEDGTLLPSMPTLDMRAKTQLCISGNKLDGRLTVIRGQGFAPIHTAVRSNVAELAAIEFDVGEAVTMIVEVDSGKRTRRWCSPPIRAGKNGLLTVYSPDMMYDSVIRLRRALDDLSARTGSLQRQLNDVIKKSKSPTVGGNKI